MCEDGAVIGTGRRSLRARLGVVVLAAFVFCPLMAGIGAAAPAAPGCHEVPEPDDGSALRCCDAAVAEPGKSAPEPVAAPAPIARAAAPAGRCPQRRVGTPGPGYPSPPLFLRHAALRI